MNDTGRLLYREAGEGIARWLSPFWPKKVIVRLVGFQIE